MVKDTLKPYPSYRPTGIPWLQRVPEHWGEMKVKYIFRERVQKGFPNEPLLAATQSMGVVAKETYGQRTVTAQKDLHLLKLVEKDDFVISLRSFQGGIEVSHARGIISPAYTILKINRPCAPGYLAYLLKSAPFIDGLKLFITGIREGQNIDYARLARTYLPWPELDEQHLIVRYLHAVDAKVKRYIRSKRKLIAALQEQKQAIIQRAVTRGLDPKVKLKPSGVEWLGEVPDHWEVRRLSTVAKFFSGKAHEHFVHESGEYICGNARFVSSGGRSRKHCTQNFSPAQKGDVLMVMSDVPNGRALARAYFVDDDSKIAVNQRVCCLRTFAMNPKFLAYQANRNWGLMRHNDGFNQTHLSNYDYKTLPLASPSRAEQDEIVRYIDAAVSEVDVTASAIERELVYLAEYHTRLIADVVTGAVDVREAAKALPAEEPKSQEAEESLEDLNLAAEPEEAYGTE